MKHNIDDHLDKLAKKVMYETSLESPSLNFTANIMAQVNAVKISDVTVYKPLISKNVWLLFAVVIASVCAYFVFGNSLEGMGWFEAIDFSFLPNIEISNPLSSFTVSKTFMYSIVFFAIMLFIQIPILKRRFDDELAV